MNSGLSLGRWMLWSAVSYMLVIAQTLPPRRGSGRGAGNRTEVRMDEERIAAQPRRVKVQGYRGIYRNPSARRDVYEHDFYGTDGRRRWKSGFPTIKAAVASREELGV